MQRTYAYLYACIEVCTYLCRSTNLGVFVYMYTYSNLPVSPRMCTRMCSSNVGIFSTVMLFVGNNRNMKPPRQRSYVNAYRLRSGH